MEKYGFIYIWKDMKRKMFYIGSHWGTEDDGYICSSNRMRNAYKRRPETFKRKIISKVYTNRKDLLDKEEEWLQLIDETDLKVRYYNIHKTTGHWVTNEYSTKSIRKKISIRTKEAMARPEIRAKYEKSMANRDMSFITDEWKQKKSNSMKKNWANKTEDELIEMKQNMSNAAKGKIISTEQRKKISNTLKGKMVGEKNGFYGKTHSKESKRKMSESSKGYTAWNKGKPHTEEHKRKLREAWIKRKAINEVIQRIY